jgi:L-cysteine:1D-myo-inositol 2-amino-2-deoxy-alpha-D-glucopyranoside ligase
LSRRDLHQHFHDMRLHNTLSDRIETFVLRGLPVTLYACGITPYDTTHLGHVFTYATADILIRFLEYMGQDVRYVQNVTDIDDDILREAQRQGQDWRSLGERWTVQFIRDMQALNMRPPDHFPRATETIPGIIHAVKDLLSAGVAYESGGNVYFHIDAWPQYGKLSHLQRDQMLPIANERGNHPDDPYKRDPLDFVLWQAASPGEPTWPSPWGPGRPGWHIECSTMAIQHLGFPIDIHCGGSDLVFPHHESEIAQAEGATGREPFSRYWIHTAMVQLDGTKMSKSLGNLIMIHDLLTSWSPDTLRLYLASHHYREDWNHDPSDIAHAQEFLEEIRQAVAIQGGSRPSLDPSNLETTFLQAIEADLDTPAALEAAREMAYHVTRAARRGDDVRMAQKSLRAVLGILGLRLDAGPEARVSAGWERHLKRFSENP